MNSRRIPYAPAEGWVTLGLVTLMCVVVALAIDDTRWVLGQADYLNLLVVTALGGVFFGFIGIPELALSATIGAQFEYLHTDQNAGGLDSTDSTLSISRIRSSLYSV